MHSQKEPWQNHCTIHPNAGVRCFMSNMILALHLDASYLSEPDAKSRAAEHFFLGKLNDENFDNGVIMTLSKIIKHLILSVSDAETATLFYNYKATAPLRVTL